MWEKLEKLYKKEEMKCAKVDDKSAHEEPEKARTGTHFPVLEPRFPETPRSIKLQTVYVLQHPYRYHLQTVPVLKLPYRYHFQTVPVLQSILVRLMQKLKRLVSEEHVTIRLRVYQYRMHQNSFYEGKKCLNGSKTSPTVTNG
ncbi:hypothetical protein V6N12_037661 [Hibiscus sabdariffa]|uniref:Uncharacterized protein n=1 Tax=Hibiscus sabdariffa TaxID=183260 RepID=A0ABR2C1E8_9ROSI